MTVGGAGLALVETLIRFAQTIKSAERDVGHVAGDIRSTVAVLNLIRLALEKAEGSQSPIIQTSLDILPDLTNQCTSCFEIIQGLIAYLEPFYDPTIVQSRKGEIVRYSQSSKRPQFLEKYKWRLKRPEVERLRSYLQSLKSSLHLLLTVVDLELAAERHASTNTRQVLREEVERAYHKFNNQRSNLDDVFADQRVSGRRRNTNALVRQHDQDDGPQAALRSLALTVVTDAPTTRPTLRRRKRESQMRLENGPSRDRIDGDPQRASQRRSSQKSSPENQNSTFPTKKASIDSEDRFQDSQVSSEDEVRLPRNRTEAQPSRKAQHARVEPDRNEENDSTILTSPVVVPDDSGSPRQGSKRANTEPVQDRVSTPEESEHARRRRAAQLAFNEDELSRMVETTTLPIRSSAYPSQYETFPGPGLPMQPNQFRSYANQMDPYYDFVDPSMWFNPDDPWKASRHAPRTPPPKSPSPEPEPEVLIYKPTLSDTSSLFNWALPPMPKRKRKKTSRSKTKSKRSTVLKDDIFDDLWVPKHHTNSPSHRESTIPKPLPKSSLSYQYVTPPKGYQPFYDSSKVFDSNEYVYYAPQSESTPLRRSRTTSTPTVGGWHSPAGYPSTEFYSTVGPDYTSLPRRSKPSGPASGSKRTR